MTRFVTPLTVKTRLTLVFKLHFKLLIHNTKTLSFSSKQHCSKQHQQQIDKLLF